MKLQVTSCRLQVSRRNQASRGTFNLQPSTFNPAFTLIEMLVVISILGILAGLAVPALKNIGKSDANISASRQLLDDVGRARQKAIANHTTVYMVFVPTNYFSLPCVLNNNAYPDLLTGVNNITSAADKSAAFIAATNLVDKQLNGYSFVSHGSLGDQPGSHLWHYLEPWQNLPQGAFIAAQKFLLPNTSFSIPQWLNDYANQDNWRLPALKQIYGFTNALVPFPTENSPLVLMPCIAFDYSGRLVSEADAFGNYHDAYIPLAHGYVSYGIDPATKSPLLTPVAAGDVAENPPGNSGIGNNNYSYNVIHIDALTGRATLEFHKLQ